MVIRLGLVVYSFDHDITFLNRQYRIVLKLSYKSLQICFEVGPLTSIFPSIAYSIPNNIPIIETKRQRYLSPALSIPLYKK